MSLMSRLSSSYSKGAPQRNGLAASAAEMQVSLKLIVIITVIIAGSQGSPSGRIVYPRVIEERSATGKIIVEVTKKIVLHLETYEVFLSRLRFDVEKAGSITHKVINGTMEQKDLYVDSTHQSSLLMQVLKAGVIMTGIINANLRIRPTNVSSRLLHLLQPHALEPINMSNVEDTQDNKTLPPLFIESRAPQMQMHGTIYPELCIVVDPNYAKDVPTEELIRYLIVFVTGLNMKLEDLTEPRVHLRLVGVLVLEAMMRSYYRIGKHVHPTYTFSNFFREITQLGLGSPDIYLLLTQEDLIEQIGGVWDQRVSGFSPIGGMCIFGQNAAIVEDIYGSFIGLEVAVHELGHMFGCVDSVKCDACKLGQQDTKPDYVAFGYNTLNHGNWICLTESSSYLEAKHWLGAPHDEFPQYEEQCGWSRGYIMSYLDVGETKNHFSPCSKSYIKYSLSLKVEQCFALTFVLDYLRFLPGVLPGHMLDGQLFCKAQHPHIHNIYFPTQSAATLFQCRLTCNVPSDAHGAYTYYTHRAPEGTPCHTGAICMRGQCLRPVSYGR